MRLSEPFWEVEAAVRADAVLAVKRGDDDRERNRGGIGRGPGGPRHRDERLDRRAQTLLLAHHPGGARQDWTHSAGIWGRRSQKVPKRSVGAGGRPLNRTGDGRAKDDSLAQ